MKYILHIIIELTSREIKELRYIKETLRIAIYQNLDYNKIVIMNHYNQNGE